MNRLRRLPVVKIQDIQPELRRLQRRGFLRNALSLGGVALLTGCDLSTNSGVDAALKSILRFDDKVQAALFSGQRLAQSYSPSALHPRTILALDFELGLQKNADVEARLPHYTETLGSNQ